MSTSSDDEWEGQSFLKRNQIFTNEHCNLLF